MLDFSCGFSCLDSNRNPISDLENIYPLQPTIKKPHNLTKFQPFRNILKTYGIFTGVLEALHGPPPQKKTLESVITVTVH